jgi:hypothetical protein
MAVHSAGSATKQAVVPNSAESCLDMMEGNYQGQHWLVWFLWKEGVPPSDTII